jgi:hypothetical protein
MAKAASARTGRGAEVRRFSPAALERFRRCPKAFEFQHITGAQGQRHPSPLLGQANAIHHALERFFGVSQAASRPTKAE